MMNSVTGNTRPVTNLTMSKTGDLANTTATLNPSSPSVSWSHGTGANAINQEYSDTLTLAAAASTTLDLAGGLTDRYGDTVTFTAIKYMMIYNKSSDATLLVGGAGAAAFGAIFSDDSDILEIGPGGWVQLCNPSAAGYTVGAGTSDELQLEHDGIGSDDMEVDIILGGIV